MKKFIREKTHRLPLNLYAGKSVISFTLCLEGRKELFASKNIFEIFNKFLLDEIKKHDCSAYVYLFMPDHAHLLITGNNFDSKIKICVDRFKQKTGFWLSHNTNNIKWQKDYYDHILRKEDDLLVQTKYILNNPVRKGLVEYWKDCLFKGSTIYDLNNW